MKGNCDPQFIELTRLKLLGPQIDVNWYRHITSKNGLPYFPAILMLADAVYWSKPTAIINEETGKIIECKKETEDKYLLRSAANYNTLYGLSKKQVETARSKLVELGLIRLEEKLTMTSNNKTTSLGYYTIPVIENIKKITNNTSYNSSKSNNHK